MLQVTKKFGKFVGTATVLTGLGLLTLIPIPAQNAADAGSSGASEGAGAEAGSYALSGGPVRGKKVITSTVPRSFPESAGWYTLPGSLSWGVAAGTTDLFNVTFSGECGAVGGASVGDWVRIRVLDNGVPMEPYDGNSNFCGLGIGANNTGMGMHAAVWAKRVAAGAHTLVVQFQIVDNAPLGVVTAFIDDYTFELVVYD